LKERLTFADLVINVILVDSIFQADVTTYSRTLVVTVIKHLVPKTYETSLPVDGILFS